MADSLLLDLPNASALSGSESVYGVQSAADVKIAISQIVTKALASPAITGTGTATTQSPGDNSTKLATTAYADAAATAIIAAADAMVFKGVVDCSANPNYPAADCGHTYRVSVAGKIGGGSGLTVEAGDLLLCLTDGTAAGNQATVGAHWSIAQTNLDGAVIGPASVTDGNPALFDGTTGKLLKQVTFATFKASLALVKADVGLGSVDNTSDASKPVSTAQQTALDAKLNQDISSLTTGNILTFDDLFVIRNGSSTLKANALDILPGLSRRKFFVWEYDFPNMGGSTGNGIGTSTSGTGAAVTQLAAVSGHPGIARLSNGTTTGTGRASVACSNLIYPNGGKTLLGVNLRIPTLSASGEDFTLRAGCLNSQTAEPTDGIYFRQNYAVNGGRWQAVARKASAESATDTGVSPSANAWTWLYWKANADFTSVTFYIDGVSVATITTNIVDNVATGFIVSNVAGTKTANRDVDVDYAMLVQEFTTARWAA